MLKINLQVDNMKIVDIFAEEYPEHLYAFVYTKNCENEYDRLMELWTDVNYLRMFAKTNKVININQFIKDKLRDAEKIQDLIDSLLTQSQPLEYYFRALYNQETGIKTLSLQKGKTSKQDGLRIYAIKIDNNCFVITGGAIKMSQAMQDHPNTKKELKKIKRAQSYLKENDVFDQDSFFEFNTE